LFPGYSQIERGNLRGKILTAIEHGDAASARQLMEADIGSALDYIIGLSVDSESAKTQQ
jgi:DNA-binding GntR family transcriptional regulator